MSKPKKWTEVYPYGTKEGDEEAKFFRALARHPKYDYRSTGAIIKATNLPRNRVEEIIDKYVNKVTPPLLFAHPSNDDHWGYWERCEDRLDGDKRDISKKDKDNRIDKHLGSSPSVVGGTNLAADNDVSDDDLQQRTQLIQSLRAKMATQIEDQQAALGEEMFATIMSISDWEIDESKITVTEIL